MKTKGESAAGWLLAAPAIAGFFLLTLGPMLISLALGFTDYHISSAPAFVGLENYRNLLGGGDPFFYQSLKVTGYYVALGVPLQIGYAFVIALVMNRPIRGRPIFRSIFYIPTIVPTVALSTIWLWLFNPDMGLINTLLRSLGLPTSMWVFSESSVIPSLVLMRLWITGQTMVIFLAGLQDVPRHLYESVDIDGGNAFHKFRYITVPMMTPIIFFNFVMAIIDGFQEFTAPLVMTNGGPNNASLLMAFYLYREAFKFQKFGNASAVAWLVFIIVALLTLLIFRTSNLWVYYEGEGGRR